MEVDRKIWKPPRELIKECLQNLVGCYVTIKKLPFKDEDCLENEKGHTTFIALEEYGIGLLKVWD